MKVFLAFVKKEFIHIIRDPTTTAIMIGLPILLLGLLGFAITTEVRNTKIGVYAATPDNATRAIVDRLAANEYFILAHDLSSPAQVQELFAQDQIGLAVIFSGNFEQEMMATGSAQVQLIADGTDPNTARTLVNYAMGIIADYQLDVMSEAAIPYLITPQVRLLYNPSLKGAYNFIPGLIGMILLLIGSMMTSISIAREKETGTMEVLLVSPVRPLQMILAKTVPYFVISLIDVAIILLMSVYVLGVPIVGNLSLLVGITMVYIFLALAQGILISSVSNTQTTALLISGMGLLLPVMMLSGMIFPIESMPRALQLLSYVIPASWYTSSISKIMIRGLGFSAIRTELVILAGMTIFLVIASLKKQRLRLE